MAKITTFPAFLRNHRQSLRLLHILIPLSSLYLFYMLSSKLAGIDTEYLRKWLLSPYFFFISLLFAAANISLRIGKWHVLAGKTAGKSFMQSAFQQLTAQAWSFFTPFNAAEYIHKPVFFDKRKQALIRVGTEQFSQLHVTLWFASMSSALLYGNSPVWAAVPVVIGLPLLRKGIYRKAFGLSALRYLIFAGFLAFMLHAGGASWSRLALHIPLYYAAVSAVPLTPWVELPVKSGAAVWIFAPLLPDKSFMAAAVLWLWMWNTFLPALTGQAWWWLRMQRTEKP